MIREHMGDRTGGSPQDSNPGPNELSFCDYFEFPLSLMRLLARSDNISGNVGEPETVSSVIP